jgi:hypothetical protein
MTAVQAAIAALTPTVWYELNGDGDTPEDGSTMADTMEALDGEYKGAGLLGLEDIVAGYEAVGKLRQFRRSTHSYARTADSAVLDCTTAVTIGAWMRWLGGTVNNHYLIAGRSLTATYATPYHSYVIRSGFPAGGILPLKPWSDDGGAYADYTWPAAAAFAPDVLNLIHYTRDVAASPSENVYLNGVLAATSNGQGTGEMRDASGRFLINCLHDSGVIAGSGDFDMAHVHMLTRAVSLAEHQSIWDAKSGGADTCGMILKGAGG